MDSFVLSGKEESTIGHLSANLKRAMTNIRGDRGLIKDADLDLWVWWFGTELEIGIAQTLAYRIHTNQSSCAQKVLALQ